MERELTPEEIADTIDSIRNQKINKAPQDVLLDFIEDNINSVDKFLKVKEIVISIPTTEKKENDVSIRVGEIGERTFLTIKKEVYDIIKYQFSKNLIGHVSSDSTIVRIMSWEVVGPN